MKTSKSLLIMAPTQCDHGVELCQRTLGRAARRAKPRIRRRPRTPIEIKQAPTTSSTGVSVPGPVDASPVEPLPLFPVEDGLVDTTANGTVVVVEGETVVVVVDVVEVVVVVVVVAVVEEVVVVAASGVAEQQGAVGRKEVLRASPLSS